MICGGRWGLGRWSLSVGGEGDWEKATAGYVAYGHSQGQAHSASHVAQLDLAAARAKLLCFEAGSL